MVTRPSLVPIVLPGAVASALLPIPKAVAASAGATINFTPPLAAAKTIQVTEVVWEAQGSTTPGPLRQTGTMTFRIEKPDKFWVEWRESDSSKPASYTISDGRTMVVYDGKRLGSLQSRPTATSEWPFPMMGLLNNMPGPVSARPAVRDGKRVLFAVQSSPAGRNEFWFDPKTHLLVRWVMFVTWQGKTSQATRTDFSGWVLNQPLPASAFQVPSGSAGRK